MSAAHPNAALIARFYAALDGHDAAAMWRAREPRAA